MIGLLAVAFAGSALAQSSAPTVPFFTLTDANGVNLVSGHVQASIQDVSIGGGAAPLGHTLMTNDQGTFVQGWGVDSYTGLVGPGTYTSTVCTPITLSRLSVSLGGQQENMCGAETAKR